MMAKPLLNKGQLLTLPFDILPFLFSFLSPKELCCLDSAILNYTDRPLFLSALIQRFTNTESKFIGDSSDDLMARWYLCRRIPITTLSLSENCPIGLISMNSNFLKDVSLEVSLSNDDLLALENSSHLKKLSLCECSFPINFHLSNILRNLKELENLKLSCVSFSRTEVETLTRSCPLLKNFQISDVKGFGDDELRILAEGFPFLRSLNLNYLDDITDSSVRILANQPPRIASIGVVDCGGVSFASISTLLQKFTIPAICNKKKVMQNC
jgi:hypothetical protein